MDHPIHHGDSNMMKALLRTLFVVIICVIAISAFLLTPIGLRFSIDTASKLMPGKLTYQKISGIIIGPITVDQLHYQSKEESVDIKKLYLSWHPLDLLKRHLHIATLSIQQLQIV